MNDQRVASSNGRRSFVGMPAIFYSLAPRIALVLSLVLAVVIGSMLWQAHKRVNRAVLRAESARLQASSNQLAATFQSSAKRLISETARLSNMPVIISAARLDASAADRDTAAVLFRAASARSQQVLAIAVWDTMGRVLFSGGPEAIVRRHPPQPVVGVEGMVPAAIIGPLTINDDTVSFTTTTVIRGQNQELLGSVVVVRRLASGPESAALLNGLVGGGARVMLGNADGGIWSDLRKPIAGPRVPPKPGVGGVYDDASGVEHVAGSAAVSETPWIVLVDLPQRTAVAAASQFVLEMIVIAIAFILAGAAVVWYVMRRSLRPLQEVTTAVGQVASGNYSQRVNVNGSTEIGQLGRSFNTMADCISQASSEIVRRASALERANGELRESELRYHGLFDHLPDGIVVHRDQRILFANPAAVRMFGVADANELLGRSVMEFLLPAERELVGSRIDAIVSTGNAVPPMELRLQRKDRSNLVIEVSSMMLLVDGAPAVQTIMHDVTERRLLEEQLLQSQKMDAVGRLAGGVAHDFNNLLTVIQAHSEFALTDGMSEADRRADIEEIRTAANSAARLTRQLLTFSRKQVLTPTHIYLNDAIGGMLGMIKRLIGDDIEVMIVPGAKLEGIWADPGQIQQVLLNLAVNARDAMPSGGMLRFETANVTIGDGYIGASANVIPAGDYVMLAVQDTGVGMTEEVRTRVFEPFFTTKDPGRGTGLGLSTVYGIIKQSRGHIWVYSEPEMGTTFKVFFPPHQAVAAEVADAVIEEHVATLGRPHLLVVEDEPSVRAAVCRALGNAGFLVSEAKNAEEALEILHRDPTVNLMITDMVMPGMSGVALINEVRLTHPSLPVVILSGYSEETASLDWRVPDHAQFLEKPVSPVELIRRARLLLATSHA